MNPEDNKKKFPVLLFVVGFAVTVLLTLIANRQSNREA
jgi:hypothetical protein